MTPLGKQELIFSEALRHTGESRVDYLRRACGDDAALRRQIEGLIAAHGSAPDLLDRDAGEAADAVRQLSADAPFANGPAAGDTVGPYRLVERIGEGGMGVVFRAQQSTPVRRTVAVKIIKPGMDTRGVLARFEAERQALAQMDHPSITRVLGAGATAAGRPWFAMELLEGLPIDRHCREHGLEPRDRVRLMIRVAHAVQHAHQKGVIHRDLKPSNVLIVTSDVRPLPKVIDFGIAKAIGEPLTDHTQPTGPGGVIGTLDYMSPEQVEHNGASVDTRTDVYALGVMLYQLLTGTTPLGDLRQIGYAKALDAIATREPARPSARVAATNDAPPGVGPRTLHGDPDWIVLKCLAKDPAQRYATASALAADLQRYLDGEPTEAAAPTLRYTLGKLCRRHRGPLVTGALMAATLVAATGVSTWLAVNYRREATRATAAETLSRQRLAELESERRRRLNDEAHREAQVRYFRAQFATQDRPRGFFATRASGAKPEERAARRRMLEAAGIPPAQIERALDAPAIHLEAGGDLIQDLLAAERTPESRARMRRDLEAQGMPAEQIDWLIDGPPLRERRRRSGPPVFTRSPPVADAVIDLAADADPALLAAILEAQRERLGDDDPWLADTLIRLGDAHTDSPPEAEARYREALRILHAAAGDNVDPADLTRAGLGLAQVLHAHHDPAAKQAFAEAAEAFGRLNRPTQVLQERFLEVRALFTTPDPED